MARAEVERFVTRLLEAMCRVVWGFAPRMIAQIVSRLGHVPVAMLVADNRGRYVDANEAAAFLTGYTRAELLRCSVWDLTPDAHRGRGQALWRVFLARERMAGWYPLRKKGGRIVKARYAAVANVLPGLHVSALATPSVVIQFRTRIRR